MAEDKLNPKTRKYENPNAKKPATELDEKLKKTFGTPQQDIVQQLTSRLPGMGSKLQPYGYTSESEIREKVLEVVKRPARKLSEKQMAAVGIDIDPALKGAFSRQKPLTEEQRVAVAEDWINRLVASAKKRSRLMTDIQLTDWRMARKLTSGDRARYIGPERNETTQAQLIVPRTTGQTGIITNVMETREARIITFHPDDAVQPVEAPGVDKQFVDLQVKEHTEGWLTIERIP